MSKQRVYLHVEKNWTGEPADVWKKFFAWLEKRPNFEGKIEVFQFPVDEYSVAGEQPSMSISIESEPNEVT
jgi:hypothetical protein